MGRGEGAWSGDRLGRDGAGGGSMVLGKGHEACVTRRGVEEESFRPGGKLAQRPGVGTGPVQGPGVSVTGLQVGLE